MTALLDAGPLPSGADAELAALCARLGVSACSAGSASSAGSGVSAGGSGGALAAGAAGQGVYGGGLGAFSGVGYGDGYGGAHPGESAAASYGNDEQARAGADGGGGGAWEDWSPARGAPPPSHDATPQPPTTEELPTLPFDPSTSRPELAGDDARSRADPPTTAAAAAAADGVPGSAAVGGGAASTEPDASAEAPSTPAPVVPTMAPPSVGGGQGSGRMAARSSSASRGNVRSRYTDPFNGSSSNGGDDAPASGGAMPGNALTSAPEPQPQPQQRSSDAPTPTPITKPTAEAATAEPVASTPAPSRLSGWGFGSMMGSVVGSVSRAFEKKSTQLEVGLTLTLDSNAVHASPNPGPSLAHS